MECSECNPEVLTTTSANVQAGCPTRPARLRRKAAGKAKALGHDSTVNQNGNCSKQETFVA